MITDERSVSKFFSPQSKSCPCKNCGDRHATCHSTCDKYKNWVNKIISKKGAKTKNEIQN